MGNRQGEKSHRYVDCGTFELSMGETKVMSGTSFQEWYSDVFIPDMSDEPRYRGSELPGKAFLVTVHAKNLSATESLELPVRTPCALSLCRRALRASLQDKLLEGGSLIRKDVDGADRAPAAAEGADGRRFAQDYPAGFHAHDAQVQALAL
ncbi:MAG: hypothetical protein RR842_14235, partial [Gordonibacter sp.]|uniref:hypothetical protein n=1 Tax=Gordonibacter sp. TaxID=1968902 RepID=UPI002FCC5586